MSLFGSIVDKIVHYAESAVGAGPAAAATPAKPAAAPDEPATTPSPVASTGGPAPSGQVTPAASALSAVDIGAVLGKRAEAAGGNLHWQTSIVDLLKVLDLDSSLAARKQLAEELNVHVAADGSAEENVALHKAVVDKLAENGGNVPADMKA